MRSTQRFFAFVVLAVAVVLQAAFASPAPRLGWISDVPGVVTVTRTATQQVYRVTSQPDSLFASIHDSLASQGFRLEPLQRTAKRRVLKAVNTEWVVTVTMENPGGAANLIITVINTGGATGSVEADRVVSGLNVNQTVVGHGNIIVVSGMHCSVTVRGTPREVRISGNHNRVRIEGTTQAISVTGLDNFVRYSAAANPTKPQILTSGARNDVGSY